VTDATKVTVVSERDRKRPSLCSCVS